MSEIGFRIYDKPKKADIDKIKELAQYPAAVISDVMNRSGCLASEVMPINRANKLKVSGRALTVKTTATDNLMVHKALEMSDKNDIIAVDARGENNRAIIGEIMCRLAEKKAVKGFILDGLIRDKDYIQNQAAVAVYARGCIPQGPYKNGPGEINVPISCAGQIIYPGDIIIGDADGVVAVKKDNLEEVISKARSKQDQEKQMLKKIRNGNLKRDWIDKKLQRLGCEIINDNFKIYN